MPFALYLCGFESILQGFASLLRNFALLLRNFALLLRGFALAFVRICVPFPFPADLRYFYAERVARFCARFMTA